MNKLKLGFTDTYENAIKFFTDVLGDRYEIVRDDVNPDYLIFGDRNFGENNKNYKNVTKIFFTGENQRYWNYDCDFAITFDHIASPKHYRLPLYVLEMKAAVYDGTAPSYYWLFDKARRKDPEELWKKRKEFASYVQSNPNCTFRTIFVEQLMKHKKIACGGPHFNNIGKVLPRNDRRIKLDFLDNYKFNIAFENGSHRGYVTEKLLDAFYANTIPIYWGSQLVHRDFNPKAFVNYMDFHSNGGQGFDRFLEYITQLENDKDMYCDMLAEHPFVGNKENEFVYLNNFLDWFDTFVYKGSSI